MHVHVHVRHYEQQHTLLIYFVTLIMYTYMQELVDNINYSNVVIIMTIENIHVNSNYLLLLLLTSCPMTCSFVSGSTALMAALCILSCSSLIPSMLVHDTHMMAEILG